MDLTDQKLFPLPFQIIEIEDGILLKRGCTVLKIQGEGAEIVVQRILAALHKTPSTCEEVFHLFSAPERNAVKQLIEMLVSKRFLVVESEDISPITNELPESHLDIFYWNFGLSTKEVVKRLYENPITILGINYISLRLLTSLVLSGWKNVEIVDNPLLRNMRLFDSKGNISIEDFPIPKGISLRDHKDWLTLTDPQSIKCLVVTSDFGGPSSFREWNQFCVDNQLSFLPVYLKDEVGFIGPLVIPGETSCFECFLARDKSNRIAQSHAQVINEHSFSGQHVTGFHPSMASILGDIAAIELNKFFGGRIPGWKVGMVLEVNLLNSQMIPRKVLKVPRCPVCSPLLKIPSINTQKDLFNSTDGN